MTQTIDRPTATRRKAVKVAFDEGDVIFAEGDPPECVYLITEGKVRLGRVSPAGKKCLYTVLGPSDVLGEVAVLDGTGQPATAVAMTDVRAVAWDRSQLTDLAAAHPSAADHLMRVLARRIRRSSDDITDLMSATVSARVAKHLLRLAQQFGRQDGGVIRLTLDLNQEQFAQLAGTSRECVNRALADFCEHGWIRLRDNVVEIVDSQPLAQRMDGERRLGAVQR
ncbi:Crp/Fnr family transcriptional regulator [Mycolicibacterium sediminis]|uniref:Putative Crp/Fnr-family transriptional regulator n=1 Tax=Mycolicibacterium sediminis TaxID=1286180 RepID=A0A7I7QQ69_9MYCO|nr:Crp/Fnr family transcriptional regulator [Mycolicibacterium sediminis]BBY27996.1 putative Crp/Fnr-family transriptional regulator [Mycolicibacterium sediminis]